MKVEIYDVFVNKHPNSSLEVGRFGFNYKITITEGVAFKGDYDSSHSWDNLEKFKDLVENGYGHYLALNEYIESNLDFNE